MFSLSVLTRSPLKYTLVFHMARKGSMSSTLTLLAGLLALMVIIVPLHMTSRVRSFFEGLRADDNMQAANSRADDLQAANSPPPARKPAAQTRCYLLHGKKEISEDVLDSN